MNGPEEENKAKKEENTREGWYMGLQNAGTSARRRVGPRKRDRPNRGAYLHEARSVTCWQGASTGARRSYLLREIQITLCVGRNRRWVWITVEIWYHYMYDRFYLLIGVTKVPSSNPSIHRIGLRCRRPFPSPDKIGHRSFWDPNSSTLVCNISQIWGVFPSTLKSNLSRDTPGSSLDMFGTRDLCLIDLT